MWEYGQSALDAVVDLQTDVVIAAIFIGLLQSIILAGAYVYWRRKVSDVMPLLVGLMLVASVSSMALALGYVRHKEVRLRGFHSGGDGAHPAHAASRGHRPQGYLAAGLAPPARGALPPPWAWGFGPPPWVSDFYPTPLRQSVGPAWGSRPPHWPRPSESRNGVRSRSLTVAEDRSQIGHRPSSPLPLR